MLTGWKKLILLPLIVFAAGVFALWTREAPEPANRSGFEIARAQAIVADIARAPHPVGTAEHARVKQVLVDQFTRLGLAVETQKDIGVRQAERRKGAISVAPLENIIAVLPGRDRAQKAVAVMAHYDSAPWSFGASDDAAGVAALLETARLLKAGPMPERDVVFLVTDAEEAGLLGAQSFFDGHRLKSRIGMVVNLEARGSSGRAFMFQTSTDNAALVDLWARNAVYPTGNSLAGAVYKRLPNDTDLSVSLAKGIGGINAAFIDRLPDYHMPTDKAENLDPRSLQHLGDFAVTTTRALALAKALPTVDQGESAYFDVFGQFVVRYPVGWGWILFALAAAALLFSRCRDLGVTKREAHHGLWHVLILTVVAGLMCHFLAQAIYGGGMLGMRERLAEMGLAMWVFIALISGLTLAMRPIAKHWVGAVMLAMIFALAAQIYMPGAHWLFIWPAIIGALLIGIAVRRGIGSGAALGTSFIIGGFMGTLLLQGVITTYVSVAMLTPAVLVLVIPFALMMITPLIIPWSENGWGRKLGYGLIGLSLLGSLWLYARPGFSPRHPKPGDLFHWTNSISGKSYWATNSGRAQLPPGASGSIKPKWVSWSKWHHVPAPPAPITGPEMTLVKAGDQVTLRLASAEPRRALIFLITPSATVKGAAVNGKPVGLPAGKATRLYWREQGAGEMILTFAQDKGGRMDIDYLVAADGMPDGAPKPDGPPTDWTFFSGSRVLTGATKLDW